MDNTHISPVTQASRLVSELKVELVPALLIGKVVNVLIFLRGQTSCRGNFSFYSVSKDIYTGSRRNILSQSLHWFPLHPTTQLNLSLPRKTSFFPLLTKGQESHPYRVITQANRKSCLRQVFTICIWKWKTWEAKSKKRWVVIFHSKIFHWIFSSNLIWSSFVLLLRSGLLHRKSFYATMAFSLLFNQKHNWTTRNEKETQKLFDRNDHDINKNKACTKNYWAVLDKCLDLFVYFCCCWMCHHNFVSSSDHYHQQRQLLTDSQQWLNNSNTQSNCKTCQCDEIRPAWGKSFVVQLAF